MISVSVAMAHAMVRPIANIMHAWPISLHKIVIAAAPKAAAAEMTGNTHNSRGLDPGMLHFGQAVAAATPPDVQGLPLQEQRNIWNSICQKFRAPRPTDIDAADVLANGVAARVFTPKGPGPFAGVVYAHGGGFVLGGLETHDDMCAEMASQAQCAVVLFDYRLAPEHPYPAQLEDSLKVWRWMREQGHAHKIDGNRLIAAGDSVGGQMSVALALALRELGLPQVQNMVLIYPTLSTQFDTPSFQRNAKTPGLTRDDMIFYMRSFLGPEGSPAWLDEKALPALVQNVEGLPPAFITVADHDPVCDDGVNFHQKLLAGGVPSELRREPQLAHSYMRARHYSPLDMQAFTAITMALRNMAHTS
jgi:acetyl esterase